MENKNWDCLSPLRGGRRALYQPDIRFIPRRLKRNGWYGSDDVQSGRLSASSMGNDWTKMEHVGGRNGDVMETRWRHARVIATVLPIFSASGLLSAYRLLPRIVDPHCFRGGRNVIRDRNSCSSTLLGPQFLYSL